MVAVLLVAVERTADIAVEVYAVGLSVSVLAVARDAQLAVAVEGDFAGFVGRAVVGGLEEVVDEAATVPRTITSALRGPPAL